MIENLENRVLLTSTLVNGTLTLTSHVWGEQFVVSESGGTTSVDIFAEGLHFTYPTGSVQRLVVQSLAGGGPNRAGDNINIQPSVTFPTTINGSIGDDTIRAGSGATTIQGDNGADYIVGGSANDTIDGGGGRAQANMIPAADDTIFGGAGNDLLNGGGSPDAANLGDIIMGQAGNDTIQGDDGADIMDGGTGVNELSYADKGGNGVDVAFFINNGGPNPDYNATINPNYNPANPLTAGNYPYRGFGTVTTQNNVFVVTEHDNLMAGVAEFVATLPGFTYTDILSNFSLLNNNNFQQILGSNGHDFIDVAIKSSNYTILGGNGIDTLWGGEGNDVIDMGPNTGAGRGGLNSFDGGQGFGGDDTIMGQGGPDSIDGGAGNDSLSGGDGSDIIHGGFGNDRIDGGAGDDLMAGDFGDGSKDTTSAAGGNDTLLAGSDADADTLQGDGGFDVADYSARSTNLVVSFDIEHNDGNPSINGGLGERDLVTESTEEALGGKGNDVLYTGPDSVGRVLNGGPGNDRLTSGLGPDTLIGGPGPDDTADYHLRPTTVNIVVSFDGVANDGDPTLVNGPPPGENDNVDATVERVINPGEDVGEIVTVQPPLAPSNVVATAVSFTQVNLSWRDNSDNETGFEIWRKTGAAGGTYTLITSVRANTTQYRGDMTVQPDTTYYYRVRAFNSAGNSAYSLPAKVTTRSAALGTPSDVVAKGVSSSKIDVTWKDNSNNETSFEIQRSDFGVGNWATVGTAGINATVFHDTGLSPNTQYSYQVRAVNAFAQSNWSTLASATTKDANFMFAPSGLTATQSDTGVLLTWNDNADNEQGYLIERADAGSDNFVQIGDTGANVTTFTDINAAPGTIYLYRVRAFNGGGTSDYSNVATSDLARALAAPSRFEALAVAPDQILLTWRDNSLIETAYVIERRIGSTGDFNVVKTIAADSTSYHDRNLLPNTEYQYRIRATAGPSASNYSRIATERTLKTLTTVPRAPSALKARTLSASSIQLRWHDNSSDETSFSIERATSLDGPFVIVDTAQADRTVYNDQNLDSGKIYFYRVRARNGSVRSAPSAIVIATTLQAAVASIRGGGSVVENAHNPVVFTVARKGDTSAPLILNYSVSGAARNGTDYSKLPGTVTIAAGKTSAKINVMPTDDKLSESSESVVLKLVKGAGYRTSPSMATATGSIQDNDSATTQSLASAAGAVSSSLFSQKRVDDTFDLAELL